LVESCNDISSTESNLATSAALSREMTLMVMWSRISVIGRVSSVEGLRPTSLTVGEGTIGGGTSRGSDDHDGVRHGVIPAEAPDPKP
jgi:hypothetical protein